MEIEHIISTFPIDENLQKSVDELVKEGWELPPGIKAVAVYHLVRVKPEQSPGMGAMGKLTLDDSKILVIPAGQKTQ